MTPLKYIKMDCLVSHLPYILIYKCNIKLILFSAVPLFECNMIHMYVYNISVIMKPQIG